MSDIASNWKEGDPIPEGYIPGYRGGIVRDTQENRAFNKGTYSAGAGNIARAEAGTQAGGRNDAARDAFREDYDLPPIDHDAGKGAEEHKVTPLSATAATNPLSGQDRKPIQAGQQPDTGTGWWDYMQKTKGGKAGAVGELIRGGLQTAGTALLRGAAGGSGGKYGDANARVEGDPFGLQGYGQLQHGDLEAQQGLNTKAETMNMEQTQAFNQLKDDLDRIQFSSDKQRQIAEELLYAATNNDLNKMHRLAGEFSVPESIKIGFTKAMTEQGPLAAIGQIFSFLRGGSSGAPAFDTGGFTGQGGKYEEAGIVHKGERVAPKEDVDQTTGLIKASAIKKHVNPTGTVKNYVNGGYADRSGVSTKGEYVVPKKDVDQSSGLPKPEAMQKLTMQQIGKKSVDELFNRGWRKMLENSNRKYEAILRQKQAEAAAYRNSPEGKREALLKRYHEDAKQFWTGEYRDRKDAEKRARGVV